MNKHDYDLVFKSLRLKGRNVLWENDVHIGQIVPDIDGYYKFLFDEPYFCLIESYLLKMLSELLDSLNEDFDTKIKKELAKYKDHVDSESAF